MEVIVFAAQTCVSRLSRLLQPDVAIRGCVNLDEVARSLDEGSADVAWIDLGACSEGDVQRLTTVVSRHTNAVIAYGKFDQAIVRLTLRLARYGLCEVVYKDIDDGAANIRRILLNAVSATLGLQVLTPITAELGGVSRQVRDALGDLFSDPLRFHCVADVAIAAGITRRSLDRALQSADLEPARTFLLAARLTWAYARLRASGARVSHLARQIGVSKPERFARHARQLLGLSPSEIRENVSRAEFVSLLGKRLQRQRPAGERIVTPTLRASAAELPPSGLATIP